jgi:hypothetical protein
MKFDFSKFFCSLDLHRAEKFVKYVEEGVKMNYETEYMTKQEAYDFKRRFICEVGCDLWENTVEGMTYYVCLELLPSDIDKVSEIEREVLEERLT